MDPDGLPRLVYPHLLSYVMDDPEGKDVLCMKGAPSVHPCEACWVPLEQLHQLDDNYDRRTQTEQETIYEMMVPREGHAPNPREVQDIARDHSTHPVRCGLFGFRGQDTGAPNMMFVMCYESMHNEDLGVFPYIVEYTQKYYEAKFPNSHRARENMTILNRRLSQIPRAGILLCIDARSYWIF